MIQNNRPTTVLGHCLLRLSLRFSVLPFPVVASLHDNGELQRYEGLEVRRYIWVLVL